MKILKNNLIGLLALAVACTTLAVTGVSASNDNPIPTDREWQIEEYFERMHAHSEAEAAFVEDYVNEWLDDFADEHRDIVNHYGCSRDDSVNRGCMHSLASRAGWPWIHGELGFIDSFDNSDVTEEQAAIIVDADRLKQLLLDNPEYLVDIYHEARVAFLHPPKHTDNNNISVDRDGFHPTLPLPSERPLHSITLNAGTLSSGQAREGSFTINLNSRIPTGIVAKILTDTEGARVLNTEVSWTIDQWQEYRTVQIGKLPGSDVFPNSITCTVQVHPEGEPDNILFTETVTVSTE